MTIAIGLRSMLSRFLVLIIFIITALIIFPPESLVDLTNNDLAVLVLLLGILYNDQKLLKE